jgi:hypothetical protein
MMGCLWRLGAVFLRPPGARAALQAHAYNEADFRCLDEAGQQPEHQPIDPARPLGAPASSRLPVQALQGGRLGGLTPSCLLSICLSHWM